MDKLAKSESSRSVKAKAAKSAGENKTVKGSFIKVELVKSVIGRHPKHVQIVKQLGLGKMRSSSLKPDNAAIRGLINQVSYLLRVEEVVS